MLIKLLQGGSVTHAYAQLYRMCKQDNKCYSFFNHGFSFATRCTSAAANEIKCQFKKQTTVLAFTNDN
jgi:hypothetical protein